MIGEGLGINVIQVASLTLQDALKYLIRLFSQIEHHTSTVL